MGEVTVELDPASVSGSIEARDGMPCAGRLAAVHPEIALAAECGRRGRASTATRCRRPPRSRHSSAAANPAAAMLAVAAVAILKLLGRTGSPPVSLVESRATGSSPAQRQSSARTPRASLSLFILSGRGDPAPPRSLPYETILVVIVVVVSTYSCSVVRTRLKSTRAASKTTSAVSRRRCVALVSWLHTGGVGDGSKWADGEEEAIDETTTIPMFFYRLNPCANRPARPLRASVLSAPLEIANGVQHMHRAAAGSSVGTACCVYAPRS